MFKIIFLSMIILFGFVASTCPNGTDTVPSVLGSNWSCMWVSNDTQPFSYAEEICERFNGRLFSIPNEFVNVIVASEIEFYI